MKQPAPAAGGAYLAGFTTLKSEEQDLWLAWEGDVPPWLTGHLLRTGPALFEVGDRQYSHWFDGLAMLYRFALTPHGVWYTNRFLRSESFAGAIGNGKIVHNGFATNSDSPYLVRVVAPLLGRMTDNGNVNVCAYGDNEFVALTEVPRPLRFDPKTLATGSEFAWADRLTSHITTAHPRYDPLRRSVYNCDTVFSVPSMYRLTRMAYGSNTRETVAEIRVEQPAYMHSFGMSRNHLILVECPLVTHPLRVLLSRRPFIDTYRWSPDRGTALTIIHKDTGAIVRTARTDPHFGFHVINAFEQDSAVVVDLVAYPDATVVDRLSFDGLRAGGGDVAGLLTRLTIPLGQGAVSTQVLSDALLELPHFDWRRHAGSHYRHVWGVGQAGKSFMNRLQKHDLETGRTVSWQEPGCYPGEPVFIASPDCDGEDDGVILSVALDANRRQSCLLVLDAATMLERARAWMPHVIPFGFHGDHYPDSRDAA